jgi:hypothetical protein
MKKLRLLAVALTGAIVFAAFSAGGSALAKWSVSHSLTATVVESKVGSAVLSELNAQGEETAIDEATAADPALTIEFGSGQAEEIRKTIVDGSLDGVFWAKTYKVSGVAHGTMGFGYSGVAPDLSGSEYGAELVLYKVSAASECTSQLVAKNWGKLPGQTASGVTQEAAMSDAEAIAVKYGEDKEYSQLYCLATKMVPEELGNMATAVATAPNGLKAQSTTAWAGFRLPDPAKEAPVKFGFTADFFGPE